MKVCYTLRMLPKDYIEEIKKCLGDESKAMLDSFSLNPYRGLRVNTLKGSVEDFIKSNPWNINAVDKVDWCNIGFYIKADDELDGALPYGKHPFHAAGVYYMQEPSAMAPVEELEINLGDRVLDLCAAPGGKSTQIASYLKGTGILVTNEPNASRAKILSENIERMGIANALVISHEPDYIKDRFEGFFNKILVDAPCSGEGMFRKNKDAVTEWSLDNVYHCKERQKDIIDSAIQMLSDGGRLVYSTCTFSLAEDEEIVEYVLSNYKNLKLIKSEKLWPHKIKGEGHFLAVFEKESIAGEIKEPLGGYEKGKKSKEFKDFEIFIKENIKEDINKILPYEPSYVCFGEELYAINETFPVVKGLKVLRLGLHLGTLKKNRFEPAHAFSLFLKPDMVVNSCELDIDEATAYLHGEALNISANKGWNLITYKGYSLGWGKQSNDTMKNHYPKGLRSLC